MHMPVTIAVNNEDSMIETLARALQAQGFTTRTFASALEFLEAHAAEMSDCRGADAPAPAP
jgi:FixJ family two-component response regulator